MICYQYEDEYVDSFKGYSHPKCIDELKNISENRKYKFLHIKNVFKLIINKINLIFGSVI